MPLAQKHDAWTWMDLTRPISADMSLNIGTKIMIGQLLEHVLSSRQKSKV